MMKYSNPKLLFTMNDFPGRYTGCSMFTETNNGFKPTLLVNVSPKCNAIFTAQIMKPVGFS